MKPDQEQRRPAALISCIVGPLTVLLGLLTVLSYSAHAQSVLLQLPPDDQQMIRAQLGPSVVGKAVPSKPIDDTSIYRFTTRRLSTRSWLAPTLERRKRWGLPG
jgi:hypothetical protein